MKRRSAIVPWERYPLKSLGLGASYIAEQSYCEKRVELWLDNPGDLVSVPKRIGDNDSGAVKQRSLAAAGKAFHESISENAVTLKKPELIRLLLTGKSIVIVESPLFGSYGKLPLFGIPDVVCFNGTHPLAVIEYKVTSSPELMMSHRVQLLTYGYLLDQQSLGVREILLICVFIPPTGAKQTKGYTKRTGKNLGAIVRDAAEELVASAPAKKNWQGSIKVARDVTVSFRAFKYRKETAERELQFFTDFWVGRRSAKPTSKPRKCATCLYNSCKMCPVALAPYASPLD